MKNVVGLYYKKKKYGQVDVCAVEPEDLLKVDPPKIDKRLSK